TVASSEDGSTVEQDAIALKHPNPIYVLDGSLYRDDEASPMKKITISLLESIGKSECDLPVFCEFHLPYNHLFHFSSLSPPLVPL
uniref:Uncharacterized protein n=1 Tax=Cucumis melo TaxID=3656 RepID=A0A9I9E4G4_CUCME